MTAADFRAVADQLGLSMRALAIALGLSENTARAYASGRSSIPRYVALACAALVRGLAPWPG